MPLPGRVLNWDKSDEVDIKIFNSEGKLMYYNKKESLLSPKQIDVSKYASGLYFVKINNTNGEVTKKLIIE